jgi:hypothetical protein
MKRRRTLTHTQIQAVVDALRPWASSSKPFSIQASMLPISADKLRAVLRDEAGNQEVSSVLGIRAQYAPKEFGRSSGIYIVPLRRKATHHGMSR